jgi:hypothetical protein
MRARILTAARISAALASPRAGRFAAAPVGPVLSSSVELFQNLRNLRNLRTIRSA